MKSAQNLVDCAYLIRHQLAEKNPDLAEKMLGIRFRVSSRMTRAGGNARPFRGIVTISLPYFSSEENFAKHFRSMLTHEIAHCLTPGDHHGAEWYAMDIRLGGTGKRCHTMELAEGFQPRRKRERIEVACPSCSKPMKLGPTQARRQKLLGNVYRHKVCP